MSRVGSEPPITISPRSCARATQRRTRGTAPIVRAVQVRGVDDGLHPARVRGCRTRERERVCKRKGMTCGPRDNAIFLYSVRGSAPLRLLARPIERPRQLTNPPRPRMRRYALGSCADATARSPAASAHAMGGRVMAKKRGCRRSSGARAASRVAARREDPWRTGAGRCK